MPHRRGGRARGAGGVSPAPKLLPVEFDDHVMVEAMTDEQWGDPG